jgi:hypothetical protein
MSLRLVMNVPAAAMAMAQAANTKPATPRTGSRRLARQE